MTLTGQMFIGGGWVDSASDVAVPVINPATETVIARVPQGSVTDIEKAIRSAKRAFDEGPWPRMRPTERSKLMLKMADAIERRKEEIIQLNMSEAGSTRMVAENAQFAAPLTQFTDMAERVLLGFPFEQGMLPLDGNILSQGVVLREPAGVAALITPFNFPFLLNLNKLGPALAAGCTAILKPSPYTPLEAFVLGEVAEEVELPPGVLNVVTGDQAAGEALTSSTSVDIVSFTGSDVVGRKVMGQAAETVKRVVLELGGKSANIIFADADLGRAASDAVAGFTLHCGQTCTALTRVLVQREVYDDVVAAAADALSKIKVGDPNSDGVNMGPLISHAQRERVEGFIRRSSDDGGRVVYGGGRPTGLDQGWFIEPTLIEGVSNDSPIAQEEIFGPVGVAIPFDTLDQAVQLANETRYGLGGSVWSGDAKKAFHVARQLRTGNVRVNGGAGGLNPTAPFGGYKESGLGREYGAAALNEFLETKSVTWPVAAG